MELIQISNHCYYSPHSEYGDRPAVGYIMKDRVAALIDAGNSESHTNEILKAIKDNNLPDISAVYLTHSHWDHTFGLSALDPKVRVVSSYKTASKIEHENSEILDLAIRIKDESLLTGIPYPELLKKIELTNLDRFILEKLYEEYNLGFENIKLRRPNLLMSMTNQTFDSNAYAPIQGHIVRSPHCEDSIIYLFVEDKVLFLGDALYKDMNATYTKDDLVKYIVSFYSRLKALNFTIAIPSHSAPMTKQEVLQYLRKNYNIPTWEKSRHSSALFN